MDQTYSFKFMNDKLHQRLLSLLKGARVHHVVDKDGVIRYSPRDEEVVGNELIYSIRNKVFSAWQLLSCPKDWIERYRRYMTQHRVEFSEELINDQLCFLLPRKYRPHSWNLDELGDPARTHQIRKGCNVSLVRRLCHILIENRRGKTLAEEILRDLDTDYIGHETYRRLSRWCHPARSEPDAQPVAEKISQELFGHVIPRMP